MADDYEAYFASDQHERRMHDAQKRTVERLSAMGREELFSAYSEAIGTLFGVAHFYRTLGLKHHAAKVFSSVYQWLKKGTD